MDPTITIWILIATNVISVGGWIYRMKVCHEVEIICQAIIQAFVVPTHQPNADDTIH